MILSAVKISLLIAMFCQQEKLTPYNECIEEMNTCVHNQVQYYADRIGYEEEMPYWAYEDCERDFHD